MSDIEIEIKIRVEKSDTLIKLLSSDAEHIGESHQIDEYFTPAHRDFLATEHTPEWFRLRSSNRGNSINNKNFHYDEHGSLYTVTRMNLK